MGKTDKPKSIETTLDEQVVDQIQQDLLGRFREELPNFKKSLSEIGYSLVETADLIELSNQNLSMKTEIGQLIGLFKNFEGLLSGKVGPMALLGVIPKLLNSPEIKQQIEQIYPIIEKYPK